MDRYRDIVKKTDKDKCVLGTEYGFVRHGLWDVSAEQNCFVLILPNR